MKPRLLIMDVDGTLTDGRVYISVEGELMKAFNIKDGYAIKNILPEHNIIPIVITGRVSQIVEYRMRELDVTEIHQNICDKMKMVYHLVDKFNCSLTEIAYIGDDLNDFSAMRLCGIRGCPFDAVQEIKHISEYICERKGGEGCVREFIEYLVADK